MKYIEKHKSNHIKHTEVMINQITLINCILSISLSYFNKNLKYCSYVLKILKLYISQAEILWYIYQLRDKL